MTKLTEINGYVKITLDKLHDINANLFQPDNNWENWEFRELTEALRKQSEQNFKAKAQNIII